MKMIINKYKSIPIQAKASFWFLICSFLQKGISMITTPIFTRLLSTSEYGQFNVFNSWMGIVTIIISLNLCGGVYLQGLVKFEKQRLEFSSAIEGLTLVLCCIWTFIYVIFKNFFNSLFSLTTAQMYLMIILIWTSSILGFWSAEQRTMYKYKLLVTVTFLTSVLKPFISIVLIKFMDDHVTARILGIALVQMFMHTWMFFYQMFRGKLFFSSNIWGYVLRFNIPLLPHYLSQTVLNSADRIMIQNLVNPSSAGIYSLAYSLAQIMIIFNNSLVSTLDPWIYRKIRDRKIEDIGPISYVTLIFVGGVNIFLIAFAPEAVKVFAPPEYYDAVWCLPPIAMSVYFLFTYDLFAKFEFYFEKTKLIAASTVGGALLNIISNYIFIRLFGYYAAAFTTLGCYILYSLLHFCAMESVCKTELDGVYPYSKRKLIEITTIFLLIGTLYMLTYFNNILRYLFSVLLIILVLLYRKRITNAIHEFMLIRKS
ncbi:lipopolysaccharide biosynthesis protein [Butyrivibrio sp. MB2005]|uniref:lipopolysaccharide biosynthesis protein n=1 Tax=Butyrivibrio sp. MB2005 TaxID=1280678 RepID=UPI00047A393A|nr:oligosaccharide flippase family protein [Butyrivibrio sp. MB2005]